MPYEAIRDTIGLNDRTVLDACRTPHAERLHVVECWKMVDGGQGMEATGCRTPAPRRLASDKSMVQGIPRDMIHAH
jgi:hypothetical protein